eukprot:993275_1
MSIADGKYAVYEDTLRLLFASESVNGMVLSQISKQALKDWGINNLRIDHIYTIKFKNWSISLNKCNNITIKTSKAPLLILDKGAE